MSSRFVHSSFVSQGLLAFPRFFFCSKDTCSADGRAGILLGGGGLGVFERSTTSASCTEPFKSREAADHRLRDAVNRARLDPSVDLEATLALEPSLMARRSSVMVSSDSSMACCNCLAKVGDSSRANWLEVPKSRSWSIVFSRAFSGGSNIGVFRLTFAVLVLAALAFDIDFVVDFRFRFSTGCWSSCKKGGPGALSGVRYCRRLFTGSATRKGAVALAVTV